jgi:Protein of unknown function (DUF2950)
MQRLKSKLAKRYRASVRELAALALLSTGYLPAMGLAQQSGQSTFPTSEEASNSLVAAMQSKNEKALLKILGPDGKLIISSGDEIEDLRTRADFVQRFLEMHRLVNEPDGTTVLYIGARNWPTPIPLVHNGNGWYFWARGRSCTAESAAMKCRPFAFARSWPLRSMNITTLRVRNMRRPSTAMKGGITVFIGRRPPANPRVRSDRWWRMPSPRVMRPGEAVLRLPIEATTSML